MHAGHVSSPDPVLVGRLSQWLTVLSTASHRGLRHTGTEVAMALMVQLTELLVERKKAAKALERQKGGGGKKKGAQAKEAAAEEAAIAEQCSQVWLRPPAFPSPSSLTLAPLPPPLPSPSPFSLQPYPQP